MKSIGFSRDFTTSRELGEMEGGEEGKKEEEREGEHHLTEKRFVLLVYKLL